MTLEGTNVDNLINDNGIYSKGLMKHNRFHVNMSINTGIFNYTQNHQPVFAARVPGWDIATTKELGVGGNIKTFPMRKDWNAVVQPQGPQAYYKERVSRNQLEIVNGDNNNIKWVFYEVYPRVLYPIELKPVEDFAPMVFSVQFVYRAFDLETPQGLIGTSTGPGGGIGT